MCVHALSLIVRVQRADLICAFLRREILVLHQLLHSGFDTLIRIFVADRVIERPKPLDVVRVEYHIRCSPDVAVKASVQVKFRFYSHALQCIGEPCFSRPECARQPCDVGRQIHIRKIEPERLCNFLSLGIVFPAHEVREVIPSVLHLRIPVSRKRVVHVLEYLVVNFPNRGKSRLAFCPVYFFPVLFHQLCKLCAHKVKAFLNQLCFRILIHPAFFDFCKPLFIIDSFTDELRRLALPLVQLECEHPLVHVVDVSGTLRLVFVDWTDVPRNDPLCVLLVSGDVPDIPFLRFALIQSSDPLVLPAIRIFNRVHCIVPQALPALFVVFVYNLFPALHLRPRIVVRFELVKVASALQLSQRNSTLEHGIHKRSVAFRQFQLSHHAVKRFLFFLDF